MKDEVVRTVFGLQAAQNGLSKSKKKAKSSPSLYKLYMTYRYIDIQVHSSVVFDFFLNLRRSREELIRRGSNKGLVSSILMRVTSQLTPFFYYLTRVALDSSTLPI